MHPGFIPYDKHRCSFLIFLREEKFQNILLLLKIVAAFFTGM